jgi:hypothetical protein
MMRGAVFFVVTLGLLGVGFGETGLDLCDQSLESLLGVRIGGGERLGLVAKLTSDDPEVVGLVTGRSEKFLVTARHRLRRR